MTISIRFLSFDQFFDLPPFYLTIDLEKQSCTRKDTTSPWESTATPNNDKKSDKPTIDLAKRYSDSSKKIISKRAMKDKKFRQFRDVTVILGDSIIKDVKGWKLTEELKKVAVKSFLGATTSQIKLHVKSTTEKTPKNIILHCDTNDKNDDSKAQNIAKEIVKLTTTIINDCNSNVTVSGIVSRYGKSNEKVRSVNRLLQI